MKKSKLFTVITVLTLVTLSLFNSCKKETQNVEQNAKSGEDYSLIHKMADGVVVENYPVKLSETMFPYEHAIYKGDFDLFRTFLFPHDEYGNEIGYRYFWVFQSDGNMINYGCLNIEDPRIYDYNFFNENEQIDPISYKEIIRTKDKEEWLEFIAREVEQGKEVAAWKTSDGRYFAISYEREK